MDDIYVFIILLLAFLFYVDQPRKGLKKWHLEEYLLNQKLKKNLLK